MDDRPGKKDCAIQGNCLKKETAVRFTQYQTYVSGEGELPPEGCCLFPVSLSPLANPEFREYLLWAEVTYLSWVTSPLCPKDWVQT